MNDRSKAIDVIFSFFKPSSPFGHDFVITEKQKTSSDEVRGISVHI